MAAGQRRVVLVTAVPPNPCAFPAADAINSASVMNKQAFAHLHGHEVHLSAHNIDPSVQVRLRLFQLHLPTLQKGTANYIMVHNLVHSLYISGIDIRLRVICVAHSPFLTSAACGDCSF